MNKVTLKGKSLKGKNRVREHGSIWQVEKEQLFRGSHALLLSAGTDQRWVLLENDPDFEIVMDANSAHNTY